MFEKNTIVLVMLHGLIFFRHISYKLYSLMLIFTRSNNRGPQVSNVISIGYTIYGAMYVHYIPMRLCLHA